MYHHPVGWFLLSSLLNKTEEMLKGILSINLMVHLHKETKIFVRGKIMEFTGENWFNALISIVSVLCVRYIDNLFNAISEFHDLCLESV